MTTLLEIVLQSSTAMFPGGLWQSLLALIFLFLHISLLDLFVECAYSQDLFVESLLFGDHDFELCDTGPLPLQEPSAFVQALSLSDIRSSSYASWRSRVSICTTT